MSRLRGGESVGVEDGPLVSHSVPIEPPTFAAVVRSATSPRAVWCGPATSAVADTSDAEPTIVTSESAAVLTASGPDRFATIRDGATELFQSLQADTPEIARPRLFGGFAFHDDHTPTGVWEGFPGGQFVLPRFQITWGEDSAWLTATAVESEPSTVEQLIASGREWLQSLEVTTGSPPPGVRDTDRKPERTSWTDAVEAAIDRIHSHTLRKVVLAQSLRATLERPLDSGATLARLREAYPGCFGFLIDGTNDRQFLGATPERLVTVAGKTLTTGALAGTTSRGATPEDDETLADRLRESEKDNHEHDLVIDTIRQQLEPLTSSITTSERRLRRLATVQHLETPVTATLTDDGHVLSMIEALHPTPAVGGLPPEPALSTIRATEPFERGWYAAPIGWFDANGDGTFAVALRSAVSSVDVATLFAGVGIVGDSDPDDEWDEVQLKYQPILDALE
ncbi:isochorismate synthase [Halocatena halophila]|uniref:isochorismate synthase n=1 Tax=Halocatena halophila TaxID=2814576 RepID=UPI002ED1D092